MCHVPFLLYMNSKTSFWAFIKGKKHRYFKHSVSEVFLHE